jgi:uncharacterized NAD(P)/FAD-binding protein YdhS
VQVSWLSTRNICVCIVDNKTLHTENLLAVNLLYGRWFRRVETYLHRKARKQVTRTPFTEAKYVYIPSPTEHFTLP